MNNDTRIILIFILITWKIVKIFDLNAMPPECQIAFVNDGENRQRNAYESLA